MTDLDIRKALRNRYKDSRRYAIAEEVGLTTGFSHRRLDMMVLDCYYSNGFRIDGFEIKISTADLRRELEDPEKHIAFFDVIDYYTLAVAPGVVEPVIDIVPQRWGILVVNKNGSTRLKRKPLALEDRKADRDVPRGFLASLVRSIQQHQPSKAELKSEYERGYKDGQGAEERKRSYYDRMIKEKAEKIEQFDRLQQRFHLWGDDADTAMDEFERFRSLDVQHVKFTVERAIEGLSAVSRMLEGDANLIDASTITGGDLNGK